MHQVIEGGGAESQSFPFPTLGPRQITPSIWASLSSGCTFTADNEWDDNDTLSSRYGPASVSLSPISFWLIHSQEGGHQLQANSEHVGVCCRRLTSSYILAILRRAIPPICSKMSAHIHTDFTSTRLTEKGPIQAGPNHISQGCEVRSRNTVLIGQKCHYSWLGPILYSRDIGELFLYKQCIVISDFLHGAF